MQVHTALSIKRTSQFLSKISIFITCFLVSGYSLSSQNSLPSEVQIPLNLKKGWNSFSLPVSPSDYDKETFFQGKAPGSLWTFDGEGYQEAESIEPGGGYFIYLNPPLPHGVFKLVTCWKSIG